MPKLQTLNKIITPADLGVDLSCERWKNVQLFVRPSEADISHRKLERMERIGQIRMYYLRNPVRFMEEVFGAVLFDYQKYCIQASWTTPNVLWVCSRGAGKALDLNTNIPTPDGSRPLRDIHPGDFVFGADGKPTKVVAESSIFRDHRCFKIKFSDGEEIVSDSGHLWKLLKNGNETLMTTQELFDAGDVRRELRTGVRYRYDVNMAQPLQYTTKKQPIDPYVFGLWLGGMGGFSNPSQAGRYTRTNAELYLEPMDMPELRMILHRRGYHIVPQRIYNGKHVCDLILPNETPFADVLEELGLLGESNEAKIPSVYRYGDILQRLELIQGVMDANGFMESSKIGRATWQQYPTIGSIFDDIVEIVRSLGCVADVTVVKHAKSVGGYMHESLMATYPDESLPFFKLSRKASRMRKERLTSARRKTMVDIEEIDPVPVKCLVVDNENSLYLCGNYNTVTHNSMIVALDTMAKSMLLNNYHTYIASGSAQQSILTFQKLEDIANRNIESMTGLTNVFSQEVVMSPGTHGFIHNPAGYYYHLYNGSMTKTLNSNVDKQRGARGNRVVFDECGFLDENLMNVFAAFTIVDKDLKVGGNIDANTIATVPIDIPNQLFYISSASSVDTPFYTKFRDFSKRMIAGDPNYFVADINCEVPLRPTLGGRIYPASLLKQETIDAEMRTNPEKGAREYYCNFTRDGGVGQIIKRALIVRNSVQRVPILSNPDNQRQFVMFYDPARTRDNSVVLICEVRHDPRKGWMLDVVNLVNFADLSLKKRTPKTTQQQISDLKDLILSYNGKASDYANIRAIVVDAGAGGGGNRIPDFLWEDWHDKNGVLHAGIIDKEYSAEYVRTYPNAKNILKMVNPSMKPDMYEALIRMIEADLITFPEEYDNRGYLTMFDVDQKLVERETAKIRTRLSGKNLNEQEFNEQLNEELAKLDSIHAKTRALSFDEESALVQIDAMKTEVVNICRIKRDSGRDAFKLPAHKDAETGASEGTMHDDRAYTLAMAGYFLSELRRTDQITQAKNRQSVTTTKSQILHVRAPKKVGAFR